MRAILLVTTSNAAEINHERTDPLNRKTLQGQLSLETLKRVFRLILTLFMRRLTLLNPYCCWSDVPFELIRHVLSSIEPCIVYLDYSNEREASERGLGELLED
jgi:hypothetical protein